MLQNIPRELIQHILSFLTDAQSLHSASLTCRRLHSSLTSHEHSICSNVANNAFPSECLHDIFAAWSSSRTASKNWTSSKARHFFDQYVSSQAESPAATSCDLRMLKSMDRLHSCVQYFIEDFARSAMSRKNQEVGQETSHALTVLERQRFERAFYRFEIYCNILGSRIKRPFEVEELGIEFFDRFALWEMEQLACVHDYLMFKVTTSQSLVPAASNTTNTPYIVLDDLVRTSEPWIDRCSEDYSEL